MHVYVLLIAFCFLAIGWFPPAKALAQLQVTLSPTKDNTLYESAAGDLSNGQGQYFFVGRTNQPSNSLRRGLIAFDIAGAIPAGATIQSVVLTLSMSQTTSAAQSVSLHRVTADWGEGTSIAAGNEGGGAPATTGDATWLHRFFDTSFWTNAGGDFLATPSAETSVSAIGIYTWGSTPEMVNDVQQWLDSAATNFGWLLKGNESTQPTSKRFDSRQNANQANRPTLTITYQPTLRVDDLQTLPERFELYQNYPNPFNPTTTIAFQLPNLKPRPHVTLRVYDMLGREVRTLANELLEPGFRTLKFDASDLPSGVYYYTLRAGSFVATRKLMVVK